MKGFWGRVWPFLGLAVAVALVYGHTLDVPWYLDDIHAIVENSVIKDLQTAFHRLLSLRGISYLSFAFNHALHGLEVAGFHLVNLTLHALTAMTVFLLFLRHLRIGQRLSFFAALLFVVHPLQTQAVTYTVQRMSLLAGLFALLSILFSCEAFRSYQQQRNVFAVKHVLLYGLAFLSWGCGVLSKENAAIAPLLMWLVVTFIAGWNRSAFMRAGRYLLPFFAVMLVVGVVFLLFPLLKGRSLVELAYVRDISSNAGRTPLTYFMTQWAVYFKYLGLFVLPVHQKLEYAYPITRSLWGVKPLASLAGLGLVTALLVYVRSSRPLFVLGILWFFIALSVESTFIPLDPLFEHRLYLPIVGLILAGVSLLSPLAERSDPLTRRALYGVSVLVVCLLAVLSWQRNNLWRDPLAFALVDAQRSPHSEGAWVTLSKRYLDIGDLERSEGALEHALAINPSYLRIYENLSAVNIRQGDFVLADQAISRGLLLSPDNRTLLKDRAVVYTAQGRSQEAVAVLEQLQKRSPQDAAVYALLSVNFNRLQRWDDAESAARRAVSLNSNDPEPMYQLGISLFSRGRSAEAEYSFGRAVVLAPNNAEYLYGMAVAQLANGKTVEVRQAIQRLQGISPDLARSLTQSLLSRGR